MKNLLFLLFTAFLACTSEKKNEVATADTVRKERPTLSSLDTSLVINVISPPSFSNDRFKKVIVKKIDDTTYQVTGQARVFEAAFSYVIKEGEKEVKEGFHTTDAGAPEWGNFDFNVNMPPTDTSSYTLLLYEASAKDGSRVGILEIDL